MLRSGFAAGLAAYLLWGLFPLYWPLLEPAGPVEILAHRIVWSIVVVAILLAVTQGFRWVRDLGRRRALLLGLAAALITVNWAATSTASTAGMSSRPRSATSSTRW